MIKIMPSLLIETLCLVHIDRSARPRRVNSANEVKRPAVGAGGRSEYAHAASACAFARAFGICKRKRERS